MKITYKAIGTDGKIKTGVLDAKSVVEAAKYLKTKRLVPLVLKEKSANPFDSFVAPFRGAKASDVLYFTQQLSSMLLSGLTLLQALSLLKDQIRNQAMGNVVTGVVTDIEEGASFSVALSKYPEVFSPIYISSVRAGEEAGILDKVLIRLADSLEKKEKLRATVKSALLYPAIVILGIIVVIIIMMIFVIPNIAVLYKDLDVELPLPTRIVIFLSDTFIYTWPLLIIGAFVIPFGFNMWHRSKTGKLLFDKVILRLPVFGKLIKEGILAEFSRTMGVLIGSGTLVVDALNQSSQVTGNIYYQTAITDVSRRVEKGVSIADAMKQSVYFPAIVVQMVGIGEETGKVDEAFLKVSAYFDQEVDRTVKNLTTAMEPIIMVILGLGVGFLVFAIIAPIYNLVSVIS